VKPEDVLSRITEVQFSVPSNDLESVARREVFPLRNYISGSTEIPNHLQTLKEGFNL
jgi:hypothetical protein